MPAESKSLSEFPRALEVLSGALLLISNPSGQDSFDTNSALLTEVAQAMLNVHYTQELGDVSVFDAIKNTRVLSGTTTPTSAEGVDGQLYIKYETTGGVDEVVAMYFKKSSAWLEISLGGGNTDYIECTQAQYDAWEQAGTLLSDTDYYITDGQSGGGVVIDDTTTAQNKVWSSNKTNTEIQSVASDLSDSTSYSFTEKTIGDFFGSPLYRQGFVLTNITIPRNGNYTKAISELISGNIRIVDYKAIARVGTQYLLLPYTYSATGLANFSMGVAIDNASIVITRGDSNDLTINDLTLILEYIKVV